jgi:uncharacterized membrane protein
MTVTEERLGVEVTPETMELSGNPGETVTYLLEISNTGNIDDLYDITIDGIDTDWLVTAPAQLAVPSGGTASIEVKVTLPLNGGYDPDTITVIAASHTDGTVSDAATLTTAMNTFRLFLPAVSKP